MRKEVIYATILTMMLMVAMGIANAIFLPMPVNGKIIGAYAGLDVTATNLRTGVSESTKTSSVGEYLIDWTNTRDDIRTGDVIQITLDKCADKSECRVDITYSGQDELYSVMNPLPGYIGEAPKTCPVCSECPTCPEPDNKGVAWIIGALATIVAFTGGGIKIYKNRLGNAVVHHRHKGRREYHDPNTRHTDLKYQHRRFRDDPVGCLADVKKIQDEGGLI